MAPLRYAADPQRPDPFDLLRVEARLGGQLDQQRQGVPGVPRERGDGQHRGVARDVGSQAPADPAELVVQLDSRAPPRAVVQQVRGEGGESLAALRIRRRAGRHEQHETDQVRLVVIDAPQPDAVRQGFALDGGKPQRRRRADGRQCASVDRHYRVSTGVEPGSAASARPAGTTLRATREPVPSSAETAAATLSGVASTYRSKSARA